MQRFSEFMQSWLYGPDGYYAKFKTIGKSGDFYTAVSTSRFFGATIAHRMIALIEQGVLERPLHLIEIGAHQGYLLGDMIEWIAQERPEWLEDFTFATVERFERLREAQRDYSNRRFGDAVTIEQYENLDEVRVERAFFVANEIFDAFPCELVFGDKMAYVEGEAVLFRPADDEALSAQAAKYGISKGEVALGYETFAADLAAAAKQSVFVTFDYGDRAARNDFSIRIYQAHQVLPLFDESADFSKLFGCSDITYDVNFSHLIDAFTGCGFHLEAYKTQLRALVDFGIDALIAELIKLGDQTLYIREMNKIKTLIDPAMMGERFKMVEFRRRTGKRNES